MIIGIDPPFQINERGGGERKREGRGGGAESTRKSWLTDAAVGIDAFDADGVVGAGDVEALVVGDLAPAAGKSVLAEALQIPAGDAADATVEASVRLALQLFQHLFHWNGAKNRNDQWINFII